MTSEGWSVGLAAWLLGSSPDCDRCTARRNPVCHPALPPRLPASPEGLCHSRMRREKARGLNTDSQRSGSMRGGDSGSSLMGDSGNSFSSPSSAHSRASPSPTKQTFFAPTEQQFVRPDDPAGAQHNSERRPSSGDSQKSSSTQHRMPQAPPHLSQEPRAIDLLKRVESDVPPLEMEMLPCNMVDDRFTACSYQTRREPLTGNIRYKKIADLNRCVQFPAQA